MSEKQTQSVIGESNDSSENEAEVPSIPEQSLQTARRDPPINGACYSCQSEESDDPQPIPAPKSSDIPLRGLSTARASSLESSLRTDEAQSTVVSTTESTSESESSTDEKDTSSETALSLGDKVQNLTIDTTHGAQANLGGAASHSKQELLEVIMKKTNSEDIFRSMGLEQTYEALRDPKQEMLEAKLYQQHMDKLIAHFLPLEETTRPWQPHEVLDRETLLRLRRPPPQVLQRQQEELSAEERSERDLERMAIARQPREFAEDLLRRQQQEKDSGPESETTDGTGDTEESGDTEE